MYRNYLCNQLRKEQTGQTVTLSGWVNSRRDHGGVIFIDLRDREGLTQVVFRPEEQPQVADAAHGLRGEDVIQVTGTVAARLPGTENAKLATGEIEVVASELTILNKSDVPPFPLDSKVANEDLRLTFRYLDLRREEMGKNLRTRHRITKAARDYLDAAGFLEIETPILSNPTPEGARDFLVPSRLNPGSFYALPQAPQQYKQLLQVAGVEKYFQIARCFRDEDLRADRQPEFTQIDVEASFITAPEIQTLVEGMLSRIFKESRGIDIPTPFPRMTFREAMDRFGSDKPDTRFGVELIDLSDIFKESQFKVFRSIADGGGVIKAINARGAAGLLSKEQLKKWEEWVKTELGAKGLAYIRLKDGEWESPIVKFFGEQEKAALAQRMDFQDGDVLFFGADKWEAACETLGRVRLRVADLLQLTQGSDALNFLWVVDFPLLQYAAEENRWVAVHHPFTRPHPEDIALLGAVAPSTGHPDPSETAVDPENMKFHGGEDLSKVRAVAYDVVLNGVELGGGSIRIHEPALQSRMFEVLGIGPEEQQIKFGHLLKAFSFGAPPHGGIALGLDRLVMLICGAESIREVIAFPKNNRGVDLMTHSPVEVDFKQLRELYIQSTARKQ
ncbi:MAG TPA: aspartate--tRNA ligase [Chthoniobacteraceae bacterium]|jgi:aspartyl-tRNA synthetase|nr:aspartate--tRNA ligase [Chthoniobacteraceae bacterium]